MTIKRRETEYQRAKRMKPNLYESPTTTRKSRSFLDGIEKTGKIDDNKNESEEEEERRKEKKKDS